MPASIAPVALLLVSYGSGDEIAACLTSLKNSTVQPKRVLVADNLGDEALAKQLKPWAKQIELHTYPDNPGYGGAINRLMRTVPSGEVDWLLVVNPDVVFEPDALERLVAGADSSGVGSAGPRILDENRSVYPSARQVPSIGTGIGHALFGKAWPSNPWTARYLNRVSLDRPSAVGWLSGACVLVRTEAFASIGGFDESFFMYFEDVDLGYRLGLEGWENRYVPDAIVHHSGGHSTKTRSAQMRAAHHRSAEQFLKHRYPGPLGALIRWPLALGLRVRARISA
ncbi:MAG: glycosyltransferase family 2 protein [Microbacteriaceae bacterium]